MMNIQRTSYWGPTKLLNTKEKMTGKSERMQRFHILLFVGEDEVDINDL